MAGRGTRTRLGFAAAAWVLAAAALVGVPASAAQATPDCILQPELRDITVNQGVGTYAELVRGKETVVRFFLTKPSCAATGDVIELVSASLTATGGSNTTIASPEPPISDVRPQLVDYKLLTNDHPGNPLWVVPGSALEREADGPFALTVDATITYRAKTAGGSFGEVQTISLPAGGSAISNTKSVATTTNPIRILVVPMGDLSKTVATQFPLDSAVPALENGMRSLARQLSVSDGIGTLHSGTGGLRYTVLPTMINVGKYMPDGLFCGSGDGSWDFIKLSASSFLEHWNTANPTAQADRVMGVIWEGVSAGAGVVVNGKNCIEGAGSYGGHVAWSRITAAKAGATLGMEFGHTLGLVHEDDDDNGHHSPNTEADLTDPGRAYNLSIRQLLVDDRSTMKFDSGWTNYSTVFEPRDWADMLCRVKPADPAAPCRTGGEIGSVTAAGAALVIAGTIDEHDDGTAVADLHTWYDGGDVQIDEGDPTSEYTLVQLDQHGAAVSTIGLPVHFEADDHDHAETGTPSVHGTGAIEGAFPAHPAAAVLEVRRGTTTLYRAESGQELNVSTSAPLTAEAERQYTDDPARPDTAPALSPDGQWVAWHDGSAIRIRAASGGGSEARVDGVDPAWHQDATGLRLAYVQAGDVYVTTVSTTGGIPATAPPQLIYYSGAQTLAEPAATDPSWAPDGSRLAISVDGEIWEIQVDILPGTSVVCRIDPPYDGCRPLAADPAVAELDPAWAPSGDVAYERDGGIWVVDSSTGTSFGTGLAGTDPSWSGSTLFFAGVDGLFASGDLMTSARLTTAADADPSGAADLSTLITSRSTGSGDQELFFVDLGRGDDFVLTAEHQDPASLLADLTLLCGDVTMPLSVRNVPTTVSGTTATFEIAIDREAGCSGGTYRARVSDGWTTAFTDLGGTASDDRAPAPAIYAPADGSTLLQWERIPIAGSVVDETHQQLTLDWYHSGPGISKYHVGTGDSLPDLVPPAAGWPVGAHTIEVVATDAGGRTASTAVTVTLLEDKDNDGIDRDRESCLGGDADLDPSNAGGDPDADGIPSVDDPLPCTSANNVAVDFDPDTLYVPSSGNPVTVYLHSKSIDLRTIDGATVKIETAAGTPMQLSPISWEASAKSAKAQFDRAVLTQLLADEGLIGFYVPLVITGTTPTGGVRGVDPSAPVTSPS